MKPPLSPKQAAVYAFIERAWQDTGKGPTLVAIQTHLGLKAHGSVVNHVKALIRKGYISHYPGARFDLRIVGLPGTCPTCGRWVDARELDEKVSA